MAIRLAIGSSEASVSAHIPVAASQNLAKAQYWRLSVMEISSADVISTLSNSQDILALHLLSQSALVWLPSQYGCFFEAPHRQIAVGSSSVAKFLPC